MITPLSRILPWRMYFRTQRVIPDVEGQDEPGIANPILNEKVALWKGDITKLSEVDAIVNSTNKFLRGEPFHNATGINAAIYRAAGRKLVEECAALQSCSVGEARITKGHNLPAKHVIHTVLSRWTNKDDYIYEDMKLCYRNTFALMLRHNLRTVAFPCIGTGVHGYDPQQAAHKALYETLNFLSDHHMKVERIVFCVFKKRDLRIYEKLMQRWFAISEPLEIDMTTLDKWLSITKNDITNAEVKREEFGRWRKPVDLKISNDVL